MVKLFTQEVRFCAECANYSSYERECVANRDPMPLPADFNVLSNVYDQCPLPDIAFGLSYEWQELSLEGGEAFVRLAEASPRIIVRLPRQAIEDCWSDDEYIVKLLEDKGIKVDMSIEPVYVGGLDEVIATFCLETSGQL